MRLTCLKCGHQMELATGSASTRINCVCGEDYSYPNVVNTGICPSAKAAERSRTRAFKAAGIVKDWGSFAFGVALLGILFPLIALVGAGVGIYVLTVMRGPLARYSGRGWAAAAVVAGAAIFVGEGALALHWLHAKREQEIISLRAGVSEDLRGLLRAERLFRATQDTYGTLRELGFRPISGRYSLYLGSDDVLPAQRDGESITDPLPSAYTPVVTESTFTAVAVANLDGDSHLDVWLMSDDGSIVHASDDVTDEVLVPAPKAADNGTPGAGTSPESEAEQSPGVAVGSPGSDAGQSSSAAPPTGEASQAADAAAAQPASGGGQNPVAAPRSAGGEAREPGSGGAAVPDGGVVPAAAVGATPREDVPAPGSASGRENAAGQAGSGAALPAGRRP